MKNSFKLPLLCALLSLALVSCNAGVNMEIPGTPIAEGNPIIIDPNDPVSTQAKSRIFVSSAIVRPINANSSQFFNQICTIEARRARITGNFIALNANSESIFGSIHSVRGFIYQKFLGVESIVADSLQDLINGRNDSIYTTANQISINTTVPNFVWTGQRNLNQRANLDENCNNWSAMTGNAIVGRAGRSGSDALAIKLLECSEFAHLYCIETN